METSGPGLAWHPEAFAELLRVSGAEVGIYPAHTLQGEAVELHPYVEPLLRELPLAWGSEPFESRYDQGFQGELLGLRLLRESSG